MVESAVPFFEVLRITTQERQESMATGKVLDGKSYAGNPHVRFDEGKIAPAATPRRGSLLYKGRILTMMVAMSACGGMSAATVLFDFETDSEQKAVPCVVGKGYQIVVTNAFATSGEHAIGFFCRPWKEGMKEWPSFTIKSPLADWRGYDRLVVDVVNAGEAGDPLAISIAGPDGPVHDGLVDTIRLPGRSYVQWIIHLNNWPDTASPSNVARIRFTTARPESFSVTLDRLTLLKSGEKPSPICGPCIGRDILPLVADGLENMRGRVVE